MHKLKFYILFTFISVITYGQQPQVEAAIDSASIKIGSQANLSLKTTVSPGAKVIFPNAKNIGKLEVLEAHPVDTIEKEGSYELVQKYGLTQFDSGRYVIPSLSIEINGRNYTTQSLTLEVRDVVVDTTNQKMFDIKPIARHKSETNLWWYILALAVLALIIGAIWWDIRRRKARVHPEIVLSPLDKAIGSLKRLDHNFSVHSGDVKDYYSELTAILKLYVEETLGIPAMESTTSGLMGILKGAVTAKRMALSEDIYSDMENVLRNADMVKFALSRPPSQQLTNDRAATEHVIQAIEKSIPEPTQEEIEQSEAYKQEQLRKKERRKRKLIIAACSVIVIGSMAYFGFVRLYGYLQENVIGYPTEDLWEGEWVKSEYGNPAITISTPKVLVRTDIEGLLPKAAMANIQEVQMFMHGVPFGEMHISASTMKFIPGAQANIEQAINTAVQVWEAQGAKNITVNTEVFISEEQAEGVRAYGTMSHSGSERYYYEILYFHQVQGLQQVMILRKDQDEYGIRIAEKIKKSIQFKEVQ